MNDLAFYFKEGWYHIISLDALDHQLFIITLCAIYILNDWKKVLVLVTAFTLGHAVTLWLSIYNIVSVNDKWVEFLIPCTIIVAALANFFYKKAANKNRFISYVSALIFGLIHGLGFANVIRFMMANDQSLGWSLFGFNIGLEIGQIVIVIITLCMAYIIINLAHIKRAYWIYLLSSITLVMAVKFAIERIP